jgi:hypothetical protein
MAKPWKSFHCITQNLFTAARTELNCTELNWTASSQSQSPSYVTTDGQSVSLSWCQAPIWCLRPDFYYCQTVPGFFTWGALSDERKDLPFTIAAGPRQRSHSWVRVPRSSWPYFTFSDSRLPFLSLNRESRYMAAARTNAYKTHITCSRWLDL